MYKCTNIGRTNELGEQTYHPFPKALFSRWFSQRPLVGYVFSFPANWKQLLYQESLQERRQSFRRSSEPLMLQKTEVPFFGVNKNELVMFFVWSGWMGFRPVEQFNHIWWFGVAVVSSDATDYMTPFFQWCLKNLYGTPTMDQGHFDWSLVLYRLQ